VAVGEFAARDLTRLSDVTERTVQCQLRGLTLARRAPTMLRSAGGTPMTEAVIVSTARTPLCKSWRGALNLTHGAKLGGHVVHTALERARVDADEVEDVIIGCANPEGATGWNIARQIAVRAGCPSSVP